MIEQYEHHGKMVLVISEYKGKHKEICLCHQNCIRFIPNNDELNCTVAQKLFELNKEYGLLTPVLECPMYMEG